ncbi:hypothetical protein PFISCL1PPCAC_14404, partial [Pristionchus fissidentatus]
LVQSNRSNLPHIVVKKMIDLSDNLHMARLCLRELTILKKMNHENIARLLTTYTLDPNETSLCTVYHITEFCGKSLRQVIEQNDRIQMRDVKLLITQLLRACKYLNSASVIYRDLKPDNIYCDDKGKLKLLEFGLARVIDRDQNMTNDRGEYSYMAIEMMREWTGQYDEKVDIWSVGAILCELLTGEAVFGEHGRHSLDMQIKKCGPIDDNVLDMIGNDYMRQLLREESRRATRIDFIQYLMDEGREWLKPEILRDRDDLSSFIDLTLQFNPNRRMTVDEALSHPFLAAIYDSTRNDNAQSAVPAEPPLPEDEREALRECKRRIWEEI